MKISMFHLMPYRELPADFEKRYHSVWVDPPFWELADPDESRPVLQLDPGRADSRRQMRHGRDLRQRAPSERLRLHAQPQPDGLGAGARHQRAGHRDRADGRDAADHQPADSRRRRIRDARLHQRRAAGGGDAAGHARWTSTCATASRPIEQRERYYEAHDLILKAWTVRGKSSPGTASTFKLPMVNLWPRPIQNPYPPVWVPAAAASAPGISPPSTTIATAS